MIFDLVVFGGLVSINFLVKVRILLVVYVLPPKLELR